MNGDIGAETSKGDRVKSLANGNKLKDGDEWGMNDSNGRYN